MALPALQHEAKIIAFPTAEPVGPAFGSAAWYAQFRAEYVRLKSLSIYERMAEKDAAKKAEREAQRRADMHEGVPIWAWYQRKIGIYQTIHVWKAERYKDPDPGSDKWYTSSGLLERTKTFAIEPAALERIDEESMVWTSARGRTYLWSDEQRALALERRYLRECTTRSFAAKYDAFAQTHHESGGPVGTKLKYAWIARQMDSSPDAVEHLLNGATLVYELRALLDMDETPPVRIAAPKRVVEVVSDVAEGLRAA